MISRDRRKPHIFFLYFKQNDRKEIVSELETTITVSGFLYFLKICFKGNIFKFQLTTMLTLLAMNVICFLDRSSLSQSLSVLVSNCWLIFSVPIYIPCSKMDISTAVIYRETVFLLWLYYAFFQLSFSYTTRTEGLFTE